MGERLEYKCDNCGWEYIHENDLFMIDKNHEIFLTPILMSTYMVMQDKPVNGNYSEFYCYKCGKFVRKFIIKEIWDNIEGFEKEDIINDIEKYDDSIKIIEFDESDSETFLVRNEKEICPECRKKIKELTHDSKCPKCKSGKLRTTNIIMMD